MINRTKRAALPSVIVANFHRRFTGVSSTIKALVPVQRPHVNIGLVGVPNLGLGDEWKLFDVMIAGFKNPDGSACRVWHARRAQEMLAGVFLRDVLRQRWRLLFTAASNKPPSRFQNFLINRMDGVIAASRFSVSQLDWHNVIIHHGVNSELFSPPEEAVNCDLVAKSQRLIGLVGRIRKKKGSDVFVNALLQVLPDHPDCVGALIGACRPHHAGFKASLMARIRDAGLEGRIIFTDEMAHESLVNLYRRMEICVACSRQEGFGLTVLEAFACGTPVIATRIGAWPDLVDKQVGALIDVGDTDALATELDRLLSDPELTKRMGKVARERVEERHGIESEALAIIEIYKKLMKGERLPKIWNAQ